MARFGSTVTLAAITVIGEITKEGCSEITERIIKRIGMSAVHFPVIYRYPVDGKGGSGFTLIQPISESFLVWDTWEKLNGAYFFLCSCKGFKMTDVIEELEKSFHVKQVLVGELSIADDEKVSRGNLDVHR
mgnify:CR=1 FL=1